MRSASAPEANIGPPQDISIDKRNDKNEFESILVLLITLYQNLKLTT